MSEQLKFIISELAKEPFKKQYNLISFDSLDALQLLQVLTDILAQVDPRQKVDVREEAADQTAIRIMSMLKVLKYKPPTDSSNLAQFRQGIVQGDKLVIYPIMEWLLHKVPDLKKRAYLARYLVKVEIPTEFLAEDTIHDMYQQYEALIEEFKEIHKQCESLKSSGFSTTDIKKDIASMEDEKEQLIKRVERLRRKVESHPNSEPMLAVAKNLRIERDREESLMKQRNEQKNMIIQLDQRIHRVQQQIKEAKASGVGATPQALFSKLEEETKVNQYMLKEKLPKEIELKKKNVNDLQRVVAEPAMGHADLEAIKAKVHDTNAEINQLVEKRMLAGDPTDDKQSLFRQQATIIARKKESAAESLREARDELLKMSNEVQEKRDAANQGDGEEVLKGDEFKRYVNKLRSKSTAYKKKRQELAVLRAEIGVLSRTEEIIKGKDDQINQRLNAIEARQGVAGYRETQDALETVSAMKSDMDNLKGRTLEDISHMVQQLTRKIADKKSALAPIIKELRPMRQKAQDIKTEYDSKKSQYDTVQAGLESNRSKLEQEVKILREEVSQEESRYHYLNAMIHMLQVQQLRVQNEMKSYVSNDPAEKRKTLREQYTRRIQEQENLGKSLRDKQKYVRDNVGNTQQQMGQWKDLLRLADMKLKCAHLNEPITSGPSPDPRSRISHSSRDSFQENMDNMPHGRAGAGSGMGSASGKRSQQYSANRRMSKTDSIVSNDSGHRHNSSSGTGGGFAGGLTAGGGSSKPGSGRQRGGSAAGRSQKGYQESTMDEDF